MSDKIWDKIEIGWKFFRDLVDPLPRVPRTFLKTGLLFGCLFLFGSSLVAGVVIMLKIISLTNYPGIIILSVCFLYLWWYIWEDEP